ncbi:NUDIX domain-containing protein [Consotaella salsifontis]|nr:NUDIX domain-containing protein [Consotaella salsifontis]
MSSKEAPWPGDSDHVRLERAEILSDAWYTLRRYTFAQRRRDGAWQSAAREAYDRGNGVAILLYDRQKRSVVLTRQFRLPAYVNEGGDGMLIEATAGLVDDLDPKAAIIKEVEEETGYHVRDVSELFDIFMSPGAVTERLYFYLAEIEAGVRGSEGGGAADEGEDIERIEVDFDEALAMIDRGEIRDAKTIILLYHMRVKGIL